MSNNEDDVAVCTECHSDNSDEYVKRNPFFASGGRIPCSFCGGLLIIVPRSLRDQELTKLDNRRGVGYNEIKDKR